MSQAARTFIAKILELCKHGQLKPDPALAKEGEAALASLTGARPPVQGSGADGTGITEKQANFLGNLLDACDITLDDAVDAVLASGDQRTTAALEAFTPGAAMATLSKFGASRVIDYLVQLKDGRPPDARPARREGYGPASGGQCGSAGRPAPRDYADGDIPF